MKRDKIQVGKPVKGEQLIGRENKINELLQLLLHGQNIAIIAPRRFGKTSLILELLDRLEKLKYYTAFIDIFSTPDLHFLNQKIIENVLKNNKLDFAFRRIKTNFSEVLKNIKLRQVIEDFEFILQLSEKSTDNWELISKSIDFIDEYPEQKKKHIICAFDEFGDIKKLDGDEIVKLIRSKIQMHDNATYIFSGSYESVMNSLFVKKNSPFYRMVRIINLDYINKNDFYIYIKNSLERNKINTTDQFINSILTFTKGHPYYTQLILQQIIIRNSIDKNAQNLIFEEILDDILQIERNYLEKIWEELSRKRDQVQVIMAIINYKKLLYSVIDTKKINVSRTLKILIGKGIVYRENNLYYLTDPLFELWIKENVL